MKLLCCFVIGCLIGATVGFAQPARKSSLKVLSVKRGQEYRTMAGQTVTPTDTKRDVVLLIELGGITLEEFQKLGKDDLYLTAGERRCAVSVSTAGMMDGKTQQIFLALLVPRDVLRFKLFAGADRTVGFAAPAKIQDFVE